MDTERSVFSPTSLIFRRPDSVHAPHFAILKLEIVGKERITAAIENSTRTETFLLLAGRRLDKSKTVPAWQSRPGRARGSQPDSEAQGAACAHHSLNLKLLD